MPEVTLDVRKADDNPNRWVWTVRVPGLSPPLHGEVNGRQEAYQTALTVLRALRCEPGDRGPQIEQLVRDNARQALIRDGSEARPWPWSQYPTHDCGHCGGTGWVVAFTMRIHGEDGVRVDLGLTQPSSDDPDGEHDRCRSCKGHGYHLDLWGIGGAAAIREAFFAAAPKARGGAE